MTRNCGCAQPGDPPDDPLAAESYLTADERRAYAFARGMAVWGRQHRDRDVSDAIDVVTELLERFVAELVATRASARARATREES